MEPSKTQSTTLPQQGLNYPIKGGQSEPQSDNLLREDREGANPHIGQSIASEAVDCAIAGTSEALPMTENTRGVEPDPKPLFTRLQALELLTKESKKIYGNLGKPKNLSNSERLCLISLGLGTSLRSPLSAIQEKKMVNAIGLFISKVEKKIKDCKYKISHFQKKHKAWLSKPFIGDLPQDLIHSESETERVDLLSGFSVETASVSLIENTKKAKTYEQFSTRHQLRSRKILQSILENEPPQKLTKTFSASISVSDLNLDKKLSKKGVRDLQIIINKCIESPDKPTDMLAKLNQETQPYTPEEALGIIIDRKLNVDTYKFLQQDSKRRGFPLYPPYNHVAEARRSCYPSENIFVTEVEASVTLQGLLAHTFQRIMLLHDEPLNCYMEKENINQLSCIFEGSWGFDGSSGQSLYKQRFIDTTRNSDFDDNSIFATTFVPLKIREIEGKNHTIWLNPAPQSFRSCRPIHIQYRKESRELIIFEKEYIEKQIRHLVPISITTSKGFTVTTTCDLTLSIIDGKVYNIINNTPSQQRCPICKLTSIQYNNLNLAFSTPITEQDALKNGMSPLHAYIRCLEFLLNLGYKNDPRVRQWRVTKSSSLGQITADRKKYIQQQIKDNLSLLVDVVRPHSGTTNDGNTARRVFETEESRQIFANILGIEKWLVDDIHVILVAINSGLPIDAKKFGLFCRNLAQKYVEAYSWHPMTTTLHKILIHGEKIIQHSALPIGLLSEQAGESRNKFWRYDREHHSRKDSRMHTIQDLFHRALESSDPVVSNIRLKQRQSNLKRLPLPAAVRDMLKTYEEISATDDNSPVDEEAAPASCIESDESEFTSVLVNESVFTEENE